MGYTEFACIWVPFWVSMVGTLTAFYQTALLPESRAKFHAVFSRSRSDRLLSSAVYVAYRIPASLFGRRIVSLRSIMASVLVSALVFTFCYGIALATTPDLSGQQDELFRFISANEITFPVDAVPPDLGRQAADTARFVSRVSTVSIIVLCFLAEFLMLAKSRLILGSIRYLEPAGRVVGRVAVDFLTTLMMFLVFMPAIMVAANTVIERMLGQQDLIHMVVPVRSLATPGWDAFGPGGVVRFRQMPSSYAAPSFDWGNLTYATETVSFVDVVLEGVGPTPMQPIEGALTIPTPSPLRRYVNEFPTSISLLWFEVADGFHAFITRQIGSFIVLTDPLPSAYVPNGALLVMQPVPRSDVTYPGGYFTIEEVPFSTLLAGALLTTGWTVFAALSLILVRIAAHMIRGFRRMILRAHDSPELIYRYGMLPSLGMIPGGLAMFALLRQLL